MMKRTSKTAGVALAAAAAALLATGCTSMCGPGDEAPVKCSGVNACKGSSSCATPDSSCKGMNSCKGHGWTYMSASECHAQGGSVVE